MRNLIILLLSSCLLFSCEKEDLGTVNMRINHYKKTAIGVAPTLVLLIQTGDKIGTDEWEYHYGGISGFDYEWGYIYELEIKRQTIDNPPQDGSSIEVILEKVVSKTKAVEGLTFEIELKSKRKGIEWIVLVDSATEYLLANEQIIECSNLCQEIGDALVDQEEVLGVFTHAGSNRIRLEALRFE